MPNKKAWFLRLFLNYFLFRGIVTQGCLSSQRINAIVSSYLSLLDLQSSPTVLPSALAHHVDPNSSPPEHTDQYTRVEMSGVAPESTAPSLGRNYNNIVIIRHTYLCVNQARPTTLFVLTANSYSLSVHSFIKIITYNNIPTMNITATMPMLVVSFDVLTVCGRIASCRYIFQLTGSISFGR